MPSPDSYRLLTHVKAGDGVELRQGQVVKEDDLPPALLQTLLEHGSAEPYDPHAKAGAPLAEQTAAKIRDAALDELRAAVAERDETIRSLRSKLEIATGKGEGEADRRRAKAHQRATA